jgi:cytochrome bd ubiquinol oxidase subunit I
LQIFVGDGVGVDDMQLQPAKLAAMESHWNTNPPGTGAAWHILAWPDEDKEENKWEISIPYGLSLLVTKSLTGQVKGLREIPRQDRPPILIPFYSFRIMVACGTVFFFLMLWTLWEWHTGNLVPERIGNRKPLLYSWMVCLPLSYIAMEAGWAVREVGRQPWIIYNLMRTTEGVSRHADSTVATSFAAYLVVYTILFFLFLGFARFVIKKGP